MVSQLFDEATPCSHLCFSESLPSRLLIGSLYLQAAQTVRQSLVRQPIPDSTYISSNLPVAAHRPLTIASRIVRTSRVPAEKKKATKSKKNAKSNKGTTAEN